MQNIHYQKHIFALITTENPLLRLSGQQSLLLSAKQVFHIGLNLSVAYLKTMFQQWPSHENNYAVDFKIIQSVNKTKHQEIRQKVGKWIAITHKSTYMHILI